MKLLFLCTITIYSIRLSTGRLPLRVTAKPKSEVSSIGDKIVLSDFKEDKNGPAVVNFYNEKVRIPREDENIEITNKTQKNISSEEKSKNELVIKPIPKYKDMESDEDYQAKQYKYRWQASRFDNVEHEDEDFNLDDYDFDVNHDEFAGRGKPLEPRRESKLTYEETKPKSVKKAKRNLITRTSNVEEHKFLIKRSKKAANKVLVNDYDDAFPTTSNILAAESSELLNGADSDSEVNIGRKSVNSIRNARSPWSIGTYFDRIGEKASAFMTKMLSFLPLFPQMPDQRKIDGAHSNR